MLRDRAGSADGVLDEAQHHFANFPRKRTGDALYTGTACHTANSTARYPRDAPSEHFLRTF